jgi:hypothetical protein
MGLWRELGFHVKIAKMEDQVGTMGAKREKNDWIGAILRSGRQNGHETVGFALQNVRTLSRLAHFRSVKCARGLNWISIC